MIASWLGDAREDVSPMISASIETHARGRSIGPGRSTTLHVARHGRPLLVMGNDTGNTEGPFTHFERSGGAPRAERLRLRALLAGCGLFWRVDVDLGGTLFVVGDMATDSRLPYRGEGDAVRPLVLALAARGFLTMSTQSARMRPVATSSIIPILPKSTCASWPAGGSSRRIVASFFCQPSSSIA